MSPVGINGVDKQGVDVNGVQVKQALDATIETVNKGVYAATTLSAVDADLAPGNISSGVTIFGKLGTLSQSAAEDIDTVDLAGINIDSSTTLAAKNVSSSVEETLATSTNTHAAGSLTYACAVCVGKSSYTDAHKLRLYMDGVQMQESAFWNLAEVKALSDVTSMPGAAQICYCTLTAPGVGYTFWCPGGDTGEPIGAVMGVGSIKVV